MVGECQSITDKNVTWTKGGRWCHKWKLHTRKMAYWVRNGCYLGGGWQIRSDMNVKGTKDGRSGNMDVTRT